MLSISSKNLEEAYWQLVKNFYERGGNSSDPELLSESPFSLELTGISELRHWRRDGSILVAGSDSMSETIRAHYTDRIPQTKMDEIVELLQRKPYSKKAVIQIWEHDDIRREIGSACMMYLWFRKVEDGLECHVHIRASDIFNKLRANLIITTQIHTEIAQRLKLKLGPFRLISDCGHLYRSDEKKIRAFLD